MPSFLTFLYPGRKILVLLMIFSIGRQTELSYLSMRSLPVFSQLRYQANTWVCCSLVPSPSPLFSLHLYFLLTILDPFLNSIVLSLFPLVCMCILYMVVYGLHASQSVHVAFKEQPWGSVLPSVLFWDRLSLLFDTTNTRQKVYEHQRFSCLCLMLPHLALHGVSGFKIRSLHLCGQCFNF